MYYIFVFSIINDEFRLWGGSDKSTDTRRYDIAMQYYIFFFFFFNYICNLNLNCKAVFMYDIVFFFFPFLSWKPGRKKRTKKKKPAMAGNRTRINCLEGNYADHYTTIAVKALTTAPPCSLVVSVEWRYFSSSAATVSCVRLTHN